jgi:hypothetical protein
VQAAVGSVGGGRIQRSVHAGLTKSARVFELHVRFRVATPPSA